MAATVISYPNNEINDSYNTDTTFQSAELIKCAATGVPLLPNTPQASGCVSETAPFALKVVIIGAPIFSAKVNITWEAFRAP